VVSEDSAPPEWVEPLCQIALNWKKGDLSILQHFGNASPDLSDKRFPAFVRAYLSHHPALISAWQEYSKDKRTSPSPYLDGRQLVFSRCWMGKGDTGTCASIAIGPPRVPTSYSERRCGSWRSDSVSEAIPTQPSPFSPIQCALTATSVLSWLRFRRSDSGFRLPSVRYRHLPRG